MSQIIAFLTELMRAVDVPSVVLLVMVLCAILAGYAAQRKEGFDWGEMIRDEAGKLSAFRLAIFPTWAISAWMLIFLTMNIRLDSQTAWVDGLKALFPWYVTFLVVWSGAKIIEKVLDIVIARFFPQLSASVATTAGGGK